MPKITSVEPQKKNPHRFNIFLDGQFAFGADEDLVVNRRLVVGKEIAAQDLDKILFEAQVGKLMERMHRLFNIRQRSEKEVRDYFKNLSFKRKVKGQEEISSYIVDATVQQLKQKGLLNDEQFARDWTESRRKKYGLNRIKQELFQKGIAREIIEEVISDRREEISETNLATQVLQKKLKTWKNLPELELKKKAYEYLMRRGFEYSVVKETVRTILARSEE